LQVHISQFREVRTVAYNPAIEKENRDVNSQLSFFIFLFHGGNKLNSIWSLWTTWM